MPRRKQAPPPQVSSGPMPEFEPLLTIADVQKILLLSKPKVYQLMHTNGLPSLKLNGARRFERVQLLAWLEQQRNAS